MPMDRVICTATNEEVTMDYCKQCARDIPSPCGYDYALIKRIHDALQPRDGIHVTDLVHCIRRAFYERTQPVPERVADVMYRILGTATHALLEYEQDEYLMTEIPLEYKGIVGRVDAYYPESGTLVDYKTTRWLKKAYLPYGDHELQVNIYRWLLENNGYTVNRMFLHYIDLSGPSKCRSCKVPLIQESGVMVCPVCGKPNQSAHAGTAMLNVPIMLMEEIERFVLEQKQALEESVQSGEMPEAKPGFLCEYCQFNQVCPDSQARARKE
jgi:CRISPR/Cas system-associated exonuclease Cas4 (RecB family)